jgi:hypothetical protein
MPALVNLNMCFFNTRCPTNFRTQKYRYNIPTKTFSNMKLIAHVPTFMMKKKQGCANTHGSNKDRRRGKCGASVSCAVGNGDCVSVAYQCKAIQTLLSWASADALAGNDGTLLRYMETRAPVYLRTQCRTCDVVFWSRLRNPCVDCHRRLACPSQHGREPPKKLRFMLTASRPSTIWKHLIVKSAWRIVGGSKHYLMKILESSISCGSRMKHGSTCHGTWTHR